MQKIGVKNYTITKFSDQKYVEKVDLVAIEEPLQIVLIYNKEEKEFPFTVTMRTPINDFELTTGLLYSEGIIAHIDDVEHIRYCVNTEENHENKIKVTLKSTVKIDWDTIQRNQLSNSSCGVCGKVVLEQICNNFSQINFTEKVDINILLSLPNLVRKEQLLFKHTGGIHACALFSSGGSLISIKEDIGKHNAFDKLIGNQLIQKESFKNTIAVLSGRVGYEMAQKAAKAKIPVILAIGAPTSLAIEICKQAGICLIGFVKNQSFNVYSHPEYLNFKS